MRVRSSSAGLWLPVGAGDEGVLPSAKYGHVPLGDRHSLGVVRDSQIHDSVRVLDLDRTDITRFMNAQAATLDHRRAAHPDARSSLAITTSQHPSRAALPAKQ